MGLPQLRTLCTRRAVSCHASAKDDDDDGDAKDTTTQNKKLVSTPPPSALPKKRDGLLMHAAVSLAAGAAVSGGAYLVLNRTPTSRQAAPVTPVASTSAVKPTPPPPPPPKQEENNAVQQQQQQQQSERNVNYDTRVLPAGAWLSDGMSSGNFVVEDVKVDLNDRMGYLIQSLFMQPLPIKIAALFSVFVPAVAIGATLYRVAVPDTTLGTAIFKSYSWLNNVCGADVTSEETAVASFVANTLFMCGILTFAILLGFVSDEISGKVESVKTGNFRVLAQGHTVIVGWNDNAMPLLRQMAIARAEGRKDEIPAPIVVLTERDREEVRAEIEGEFDDNDVLRDIIIRTGTPYDLGDQRRVGLHRAKKVVLLHDFREANYDDMGSQTMKEAMKAASFVALNNSQDIVVQMSSNDVGQDTDGDGIFVPDLVKLALKALKKGTELDGTNNCPEPREVYGSYSIGRLLAQCAYQEGLALSLGTLLTQCDDSPEFYVLGFPELEGLRFGDARECFDEAYLVGVNPGGVHGKDEKVIMPPDDNYVIGKKDFMVGIADSETAFMKLNKRMIRKIRKSGSEVPPEPFTRYNPLKKMQKSKHVMIGWNNEVSSGYIRGWSECANRGSKLSIITEDASAQRMVEAQKNASYITKKKLILECVPGSPLNAADLVKGGALDADALIFLSDAKGGSDQDAKILSSLLVASDLPYKSKRAEGRVRGPNVLAGISNARTQDLINNANLRGAIRFGRSGSDEIHTLGSRAAVQTLLIDEIVSGTIVQSVASSEVNLALNQITRGDGKSQICLHPASMYIKGNQEETLPFRTISTRVDNSQNRTIAIGYVNNEGRNVEVELAPNPNKIVTLGPEDYILCIQAR